MTPTIVLKKRGHLAGIAPRMNCLEEAMARLAKTVEFNKRVADSSLAILQISLR